VTITHVHERISVDEYVSEVLFRLLEAQDRPLSMPAFYVDILHSLILLRLLIRKGVDAGKLYIIDLMSASRTRSSFCGHYSARESTLASCIS
jgi:hypothetical protein